MESRRHRELERLFNELNALGPDERRRILDRDLAADDEFRHELEALFRANDASTIDLQRRLTEPVRAEEHGLADTDRPSAAAPAAGWLPKPGDRIAQYTILRELDRGGMGAVYLARDDRLARNVALKWLLSTERDLVHRFTTEARATARCRHENIVVIHEVEEHEGHPYIVFEYLEGKTLRQWMREQSFPLSLGQVLDIVLPVVRALICAHALDVVHRDLKPENVMLTASGAVKVLDFGIAKVLPGAHATTVSRRAPEPQRSHTQQGAILGTLPYMSPEQWGADSVDHRTDIWAVGILLHELLTGKHPLAPLDSMKLQGVVDLNVPMPRLIEVEPDLIWLAPIVNDCLRKPKKHRVGSAVELHERLERHSRLKGRIPEDEAAPGSFPGSITALLLNSDIPVWLSEQVSIEVRREAAGRIISLFKGYTILCVDDQETNCKLLARAFGPDNHTIIAKDAYVAMDLLRKHEFDIILTDELMPNVLGTELARHVGSNYPGLEVMMITGAENSPSLKEALESPDSPVVDVMLKPVQFLEVMGRVIEACDAAFSEVVRQTWPDYLATKPVLLECRRIIREFMGTFGSEDIFQIALRHKIKECVHAYARTVIVGEPGARSAASLRVSLLAIRRLMERIQVGETLGIVGYLESITRDLADDCPALDFSIDVVSPLPITDQLSGIQTLLTLSAIELIDNARDALESQGQIRVQLRERASTRAISLKVWSNSPPIPSEIAERIFDEGVSTKGPGRGMGLAIVKAMVNRFRGEIRLLQHDGVAFLVTIPLPAVTAQPS